MIINKIIILILILTPISILNANYKETLILYKKEPDSIKKYSIKTNDLILIKIKKVIPESAPRMSISKFEGRFPKLEEKLKERRKSFSNTNNVFSKQKFFGGKFIKIESDSIFIKINSLINKEYLKSFHINNVETIYSGNIRNFKDLHMKWSLYLSIMIIPGSIEMAKHRDEMFSHGFATFITWSLFSMISNVTYAPIIAHIDFHTRKNRALKFNIGANDWKIK